MRKEINFKKSRMLILVLFSLVLLPVVYSLTLSTDKIEYQNNDLTVIFKDAGNQKGYMNLVSHTSISEIKEVSPGWDVTMYYDTYFDSLQSNIIQEPVFIDLNTGKIVDREYKFVQWITEEREKSVCSNYEKVLLNSTNSTYTNGECLTYSKEKYMFEGWEDYNSRDIPKGASRIGLMVYSELNDYIDGVWKVDGQSITKHAGWEASLESGLISYYKLDETTGAVIDSHGTNDGTNNGATRGVTGKVNNAFDFDGTNDNINIPALGLGTNGARSISLWFKDEGLATNMYDLYYQGIYDEAGRSFTLSTNIDGSNSRRFSAGSSGIALSTPDNSFTTTGFTHVVLVYSGSGVFNDASIDIYVNGVSQPLSLLGSQKTLNVPDNYNSIGNNRDANANFVNGIIDEVAIYNRALTSTEVELYYQNGLDGFSYGDLGLILPSVETNTATSVTSSTANLNGELLTLGDYNSTNVFFQYIKTEDLV